MDNTSNRAPRIDARLLRKMSNRRKYSIKLHKSVDITYYIPFIDMHSVVLGICW